MYVQPAFRLDRASCLAFAAARGFGLVIAYDGERPIASPLPFELSSREDGTPCARFHVARANPLASLAQRGGSWLIAVAGADAYVPADWYASPEQVPTWLYEAVHLSGRVRPLPAEATRDHLDRLVESFDRDGQAWTADRVTPGRLTHLMQAIVVIDMEIDLVEGSAKLNQNKSDADYAAVAARLQDQPDPMAHRIAARMVALRPHLVYEMTETAKESCDA